MKTEHICPSCQKPLPEGAPQGLCPECLMKAGLGSTAAKPGGTPRFAPPSVSDIAKLFPQLEILELIGQGGMGAVYRARQPGLDRLVAIKILPPESTAESGFAERFAREARALAKLDHPNIVHVYDFGKAAGLHYFIMEYVDGLNLRQLEQGGRLSSREALEIIPQMCDALQFAHDEGIVHRDVKPENVMVDQRGRVKITDFGLAKLLGREPESLQLTGAKDVMGTPHYMAPEQIEKPQAVDHRADIYSLGVVFYELLTGELPIGKFAPPSRKVEVDVRLDEVVLHTLEKEPELRYQHASEVKTDVESIAHTPGAPAPAPSPAISPEAAAVEDARRQVKGPATGLLVAAILNWVGIPLFLLVAFFVASAREGGAPRAALVWLPLAALVLSGVMLVAGLKMKRLQAYWLAIVGSILAIVVTPGNIVGLPVGIWSLVVLTQKRVRNCFGEEHPPTPLQAAPATAGGGVWKVAAVIVAAVMLIIAIPAGLLLVGMALPALHRAKASAAERTAQRAEAARMRSAAFGPVKEVTLNGLETGRGSEALDLDSQRVLDLPVDIGKRPESEQQQFLTTQGLDLLVERCQGQWGLMTPAGNELTLSSVPDDFWINGPVSPPPATVKAVFAETIRRGCWVVHVLSTNTPPPLTFSFRTGNGGKGVLRITAFGEDPDYAKVQYKLQR
ncbi:MAG TPA: serine/threonine-protein kinase [Verrucomicrobiae bacterium]